MPNNSVDFLEERECSIITPRIRVSRDSFHQHNARFAINRHVPNVSLFKEAEKPSYRSSWKCYLCL